MIDWLASQYGVAMTAQGLHIVMQPQEYFRQQVSEAQNRLNMSLDEEIEFYVVNLLCEFVFAPTLRLSENEDAFQMPMALLFKKALEAPIEQRSNIFKKMGDTSLYIAGYFQEYFNRKTFDLSYYITMGQTAFVQLSDLMKIHFAEPHFAGMYAEISQKFDKLVEILATVSDSCSDKTSSPNLLAIYDRWNQTKSERLKKILEENGIEAISVTRRAQ